MLDAAAVTALRTAAAGVIAAETLCRSGAESIAVIGCGVNGAETARMFRALGSDVALWDVDEARAAAVAERLGAHVAPSLEDALAADIVVTVTPGRDILFPARLAARGPARVADGRRRPRQGRGGGRRSSQRADLFCDDWEQASHGGELAAGVEAGIVTRDRVTELGRVLTGEAEGRRSAEDITLFDSTGLAIQDLAIAIAALAKADELDLPATRALARAGRPSCRRPRAHRAAGTPSA